MEQQNEQHYKVVWTFKFGETEVHNFKYYPDANDAMMCLSAVLANASFLGLRGNLTHSDIEERKG